MSDKNLKKQNSTVLNNNFRAYFAPMVFVVCLLICFFPLPATAQSNVTAGLQGFVFTDNQKTPAVNAKVRITSLDTQILLGTAITNERGYFVRPDIPPGRYQIEISLPDFRTRTIVYEKLSLGVLNDFVPPQILEKESNVAANPTQNSPGNQPNNTASSQDIGIGIALETQRGGSFSDREVRALPLGGQTLVRSFDELALLLPGVASAPEPIGNNVGPGVGPGVGTSGQFSVNGLPSRGNNFMVDGSDNNDEDIGVRRQGFFSLVPQPIESIQEFRAVTLLAPAQYGRNLGGQIDAISRAGTSDVHGTLYAFFNSSRLNARNFFDFRGDSAARALTGGNNTPVFVNGNQIFVQNSASGKDSLTLLQGGGVLGGPIVRGKTFFFVSAEGQLLNATKESHFAVPTVEQRGFLNSGASGICIVPSGQTACPTANQTNFYLRPTTESGNLIFSLFPFPNDPTGVYGRNTLTQVLPANARGKVLSGRIDHYFGGTRPQIFTARYNFTDDRRDLPVTGGAIFSSLKARVQTHNFSTYLFGDLAPNLSNLLRFSYGRTRLRFDEIRDSSFLLPSNARFGGAEQSRFLLNAPLLTNTTLPGSNAVSYATTGENVQNRLGAVGQVVIGGFSPIGTDVFNFPQQRVNNTFQLADTVRSSQYKSHNLAFGIDVRRTNLNSDLPRNSRPLITFYGAPNFGGSSIPVTQTVLSPNGIVGSPTTIGNLSIGSFINPLDLVAAGAPSGYFQSLVLPGKDARIDLNYYQWNFFAQDDWRARPNFTISYGLRYEYNTAPKESEQKIENTFQAAALAQVPGLSNFVGGRTKIFDADRNNFAPRVGLAYSPNPATVIRGGYGIYYDQILGSVVSQSRNVFPTFTTVNFGGGLPCYLFRAEPLACPFTTVLEPNSNGFVFNLLTPNNNPAVTAVQPNTLNTFNQAVSVATLARFFPLNQIANGIGAAGPNNQSGSPFGFTLPTRKLETPMSHQYFVGVEQQLFRREMFLSVAYVGTTGRNLLRFTTPNLGSNYVLRVNEIGLLGFASNFPNAPAYFSNVPTLRGFTYDPSTSRQATLAGTGRPNNRVGPVNQFETTGRSQFHSLQIQLRGRLATTFQYQVNYTFGRAKDDVSDVFDLAGAAALPQNSLNFAGEYAASNFDVRHKIAYSFVYDLPALKNENRFVRGVFGGWQIAGTGRFHTGQPFTVNSIYDVNLDGNLTDRLNNTQLIAENSGNNRQVLSVSGASAAQLQAMLAPIGSDGSVGRNSFRGRSLLNLDLSFSKLFPLTERQNLQFRVDVFNFTNRANFAVPVRYLEAPGFGQAVDTVTPGRRIQIALKYLF